MRESIWRLPWITCPDLRLSWVRGVLWENFNMADNNSTIHGFGARKGYLFKASVNKWFIELNETVGISLIAV